MAIASPISYEVNPIKRLHNLLEQILNESTMPFQDKDCGTILGEVFNIDPNDIASMYSLLVDLLKLTGECKTRINLIPNVNKDFLLRPILEVEQAIFTLKFEADFSKFNSAITKNNTMYGLLLCGEAAQQVIDEVTLNEQDLISLKTEIAELKEKIIINTGIPQNLRKMFVEKLDSIIKAITDIRIMGVEGLKGALESSAGALFLNQDDVKENADNEGVQGFINIIRRLHEVVSFTNETKALVSSIAGFFLGSGE